MKPNALRRRSVDLHQSKPRGHGYARNHRDGRTPAQSGAAPIHIKPFHPDEGVTNIWRRPYTEQGMALGTLRRALVVGALTMSACHAQSHAVNGPDGQPGWFSIECRKEAACREEAGDVCPYGYEVAHESGHAGLSTAADNPAYAMAQGFGQPTPLHTTFEGSMLVKCHHKGYAAASYAEASPATSPVKQPPKENDEQPDGAKIKGRDGESGVAFSYVIPDDWAREKANDGSDIWKSPKSTHGAWMLVRPWGGTSEEFAAKIAGDGVSYHNAKIAERIVWVIEAHPDAGGTATTAVVAIDGTAFALTCMDTVGDETSKACLRVLKSWRLEEP